MNVLVVDTSVWVLYLNGDEPHGFDLGALDLALREGRVYLPPVVAAELLSARLKPVDRGAMVEFLKELPLCEASFAHWARVGELRARCSAEGLQVSTPDAHVAQCALDLEGYLVTGDQIFTRLARLPDVALKLAR